MTWKIAAAAGWTLLIIAACSIPGRDLPDPGVVGADKLAHFSLFVGFACLWLAASDRRPKEAVRNVLIAGLLLSGLTEVYQGLLPFDRQPSIFDAIANALGLFAGVGLFRGLAFFLKKASK